MTTSIVVARTDVEKAATLAFLRQHEVIATASEDYQAFGVVRNNKLIAVVGYKGFHARTCTMNAAGHGHWLSHEFLRVIFDYPFRQLNLVSVFAIVDEHNYPSLKLIKHVGWKEVYRVKDGSARRGDLIYLEMRREDCRWLPPVEVQQEEREAVMS